MSHRRIPSAPSSSDSDGGDIDQSDLPDYLFNSPSIPILNPNTYYPLFPPSHALNPIASHSLKKTLLVPLRKLRVLLRSRKNKLLLLIFLVLVLFWRGWFDNWLIWFGLKPGNCADAEPIHVPTREEWEGDGLTAQDINWTQFAYAQYTTTVDTLCNSLLIFASLEELGSKAERILMYPNTWSTMQSNFPEFGSSKSQQARLLIKAREELNVTLVPVEVQHNRLAWWDGPNWSDSYTKLLVFNQTQFSFSRIIMLDSDAVILGHGALDELFFIDMGTQDAVSLRAYWLSGKRQLTSHVFIAKPGKEVWGKVEKGIEEAMERGRRKGGYEYDMEIFNSLFGSVQGFRGGKGESGKECRVLPWWKYGLLTGELRNGKKGHGKWLGGREGNGGGKVEWGVGRTMREARLVHFSDSPLGKPWVVGWEEIEKYAPGCGTGRGGELCEERGVWMELYRGFRRRRLDICGLGDG